MSKPAHKIRNGVLQVTIWPTAATKAPGTASFPAAATSRARTPGRKPTASNFDDLLPMAKLLDLAHTWITHQQQADAKARKEISTSGVTTTGRAARPALHLKGNHHMTFHFLTSTAARIESSCSGRSSLLPTLSRQSIPTMWSVP